MKTNGYKAFWNGQETEVHAPTSLNARSKAAAVFRETAGRRKVRDYDVTVVLCERDTDNGSRTGEQVTHSTAAIG